MAWKLFQEGDRSAEDRAHILSSNKGQAQTTGSRGLEARAVRAEGAERDTEQGDPKESE